MGDAPMSRFCAICTSDRGPFVRRPLGKGNAAVAVCLECDGEAAIDLVAVSSGKRARAVVRSSAKDRGDARRSASARRRHLLMSVRKCIDGPLDGFVGRNGVVHGEVVRGGRCQRCADMAERSRRVA